MGTGNSVLLNEHLHSSSASHSFHSLLAKECSGKYWSLHGPKISEVWKSCWTMDSKKRRREEAVAVMRREACQHGPWACWLGSAMSTHLHNVLCELTEIAFPISVSTFLLKKKNSAHVGRWLWYLPTLLPLLVCTAGTGPTASLLVLSCPLLENCSLIAAHQNYSSGCCGVSPESFLFSPTSGFSSWS